VAALGVAVVPALPGAVESLVLAEEVAVAELVVLGQAVILNSNGAPIQEAADQVVGAVTHIQNNSGVVTVEAIIQDSNTDLILDQIMDPIIIGDPTVEVVLGVEVL